MKRYLVTGGAGFIGSHLVELLLTQGHYVIVIDNMVTGSSENLAHLLEYQERGHLELYEEDAVSFAGLEDVVKDADGVFHLAAMVGVENILQHTLLSMQNNLRATESVLECCAKYRTPLLFSSSSEVYGESSKLSFNENDQLHIGNAYQPRWSYASTKIVEEQLIMAYHRERNVPTVIVRLFNTIGERQSGKYGMVVPRFIGQALRGESLTVYGDGTQQRCFCAVQDVVGALVQLIDCEDAQGEVINIGSQELIRIQELAKLIINQTGSTSSFTCTPYDQVAAGGFVDMKYRMPDLSKSKKLIGYRPSWSLIQVIDAMITYEKNRS
jgi:UDP-glucose 4-epimerase